MSLVNSPLLQFTQVKDNRWLMLEVCREFQRNKCTRTETDCKFAHPPPHVEVQNGKVICCFDSIKGKCQRKEPPCKYLHPPQHLREQLLQNGRNNLIAKNIQMQVLSHTLVAGGHLMPFTSPFIGGGLQAPTSTPSFPAYLSAAGGLQLLSAAEAAQLLSAPPPPPPPTQSQGGVSQLAISNGQNKLDRESYAAANHMMAATVYAVQQQQQQQQQQQPEEIGAKKRKLAELNEDPLLQRQQQQQHVMFPMCLPTGAAGFPAGGLPAGGKRTAVADSKSGVPVYQPGGGAGAAAAAAASYHQQLAAFQVPNTQQGHTAGAFMQASWTGDLFQEAACPTLTWV